MVRATRSAVELVGELTRKLDRGPLGRDGARARRAGEPAGGRDDDRAKQRGLDPHALGLLQHLTRRAGDRGGAVRAQEACIQVLAGLEGGSDRLPACGGCLREIERQARRAGLAQERDRRGRVAAVDEGLARIRIYDGAQVTQGVLGSTARSRP